MAGKELIGLYTEYDLKLVKRIEKCLRGQHAVQRHLEKHGDSYLTLERDPSVRVEANENLARGLALIVYGSWHLLGETDQELADLALKSAQERVCWDELKND